MQISSLHHPLGNESSPTPAVDKEISCRTNIFLSKNKNNEKKFKKYLSIDPDSKFNHNKLSNNDEFVFI